MADTNTQSVEAKILKKESVTREELNALTAAVPGMAADKLEALKASLTEYADFRMAELRQNADVETELRALQFRVEDVRRKTMPPLASKGAELGEKAGAFANQTVASGMELGQRTAENAKKLTYEQFAAFQDPNKTTGEKILRGLGIVALMYGAYRAAKWVVGKSGSGFWGRAFRFLGVTAASVAAINYFGEKTGASEIQTQPDAKPKKEQETPPAEKKDKEAGAATPKDLLSQLPDRKTLIDGTPRSIVLNGRTHTIAFTHKRIVLDGKNYDMTALKASPFGGDVALEISQAERQGGTLVLEAGAFGKKGKIAMDEATANAVLRTLLTTGTYDTKTAEGIDIRIARN